MQVEFNEERAKALAWSMKKYLAGAGHDVPNTALLEALAQGLGYSDFRTLKAMSDAPPAHRTLARELMKGDAEVFVYLDTSYVGASYTPGYPSWAKLVLTEDILAHIIETQQEVASKGRAEAVLQSGFLVRWAREASYRRAFEELTVSPRAIWASFYLKHEDGHVQTELVHLDDLIARLRERSKGDVVYFNADKALVEESDCENPNFEPEYRYLVAESWGHIFAGNHEQRVAFVFDVKTQHITHMRIGGVAANRAEMADVEDSLLNANGEAFDDPEDWGLESTDELPDWAQPTQPDEAFAIPKRHVHARVTTRVVEAFKEPTQAAEEDASEEVLQPGETLYVYKSPYDQYKHLNGHQFRIVKAITEADAKHDLEVLPMYVGQFESGETVELWPEEIHRRD
ncbi:hypothetical protein F6X40_40450 [Paraburkholderia sp. UCT31]|uniref:hypothetical protein n=1 Tax=Paraburkholderia sp. UCT31 TaxID=2615209 RepID=UPI0016557C24|nr:hypothetical protein [Paraburkholderia sp. UCT31]MBC8742753.1 hypothetical protein [Paraburkholderia sp. UCT31]